MRSRIKRRSVMLLYLSGFEDGDQLLGLRVPGGVPGGGPGGGPGGVPGGVPGGGPGGGPGGVPGGVPGGGPGGVQGGVQGGGPGGGQFLFGCLAIGVFLGDDDSVSAALVRQQMPYP